jgi:erythromycin esterase-like protein
MHARQILATAALCTLLTGAGFAQVTGGTIQERKNDQQQRIGQGVRSGQLTARETGNLERREASVNREEHAMRRADGGHLTAQDRAALTRRQNHISRSIYKDKHNARVR